jgi:hypothetical protein
MAVARPIPLLAPVTKATLSFSIPVSQRVWLDMLRRCFPRTGA